MATNSTGNTPLKVIYIPFLASMFAFMISRDMSVRPANAFYLYLYLYDLGILGFDILDAQKRLVFWDSIAKARLFWWTSKCDSLHVCRAIEIFKVLSLLHETFDIRRSTSVTFLPDAM